MVYAIIFKKFPDLIKIGYTSQDLVFRYQGYRSFEDYCTWEGGRNGETALRCLLGLNPVRGWDWFVLTADRYRILNDLTQEYLNVLAERVATLRECGMCNHRFHATNLLAIICTACGSRSTHSPLFGHVAVGRQRVIEAPVIQAAQPVPATPVVHRMAIPLPAWEPLPKHFDGDPVNHWFGTNSDRQAQLRHERWWQLHFKEQG